MTQNLFARSGMAAAVMAATTIVAEAHEVAGTTHTHDFMLGFERILSFAAAAVYGAAIVAGMGIVLVKLVGTVRRALSRLRPSA